VGCTTIGWRLVKGLEKVKILRREIYAYSEQHFETQFKKCIFPNRHNVSRKDNNVKSLGRKAWVRLV